MAVTLLDPPAGMGVRSYRLRLARTVPLQRAAYTFDEYAVDFGGEMWVAEYTLPDMELQLAAAVDAWIDRCRDVAHAARLGSPDGVAGRYGTATDATLSASAAASAGARTLTVEGSAGVTLLAGSYLSIAQRLYRVREDATFDGGGVASLSLAPRLRADVANGETIQLDPGAVTSLWRIAEPEFRVRDSRDHVRPLTLQLTEAIRL